MLRVVEVPHRVQKPGTGCAFYSLGMMFDFWHSKDKSCPTALVCDKDAFLRRLDPAMYAFEPTTSERILECARSHGFTNDGCCWVSSHLATIARHFGYRAQTMHRASMSNLYAALDAGHPVLICFDVDKSTGDPILLGGRGAHTGVAVGYYDDSDGKRWVVAKHPQGKRSGRYEWRASLLQSSMEGVKTTLKGAAPECLPKGLYRHLVWHTDKYGISSLALDPSRSLADTIEAVLARVPSGHLQRSMKDEIEVLQLVTDQVLNIEASLGCTLVEIVPSGHPFHDESESCGCPSRFGLRAKPRPPPPLNRSFSSDVLTEPPPPLLDVAPPPLPSMDTLIRCLEASGRSTSKDLPSPHSALPTSAAARKPDSLNVVPNIYYLPSPSVPAIVDLDVPHRFQLGDVGCGLYSLGMVFDFWHRTDANNPTMLAKAMDRTVRNAELKATAATTASGSCTQRVSDDSDHAKFFRMLNAGVPRRAIEIKMQLAGLDSNLLDTPNATLKRPNVHVELNQSNTPPHYYFEPSAQFDSTPMLDVMRDELRFTRYGECYAAEHLVELARWYGYQAKVTRNAKISDILACLNAEHPVLICVDINNVTSFHPDERGGQHTHFAVAEGHFVAPENGRRRLLVKQSGRRAPIPTVWDLDGSFLNSWSGEKWGGRYRKRRLPHAVLDHLQWIDGRLELNIGSVERNETEQAAFLQILVKDGVLETAGSEGSVRLAKDTLLHHENELRRCIVEVVPPGIKLVL